MSTFFESTNNNRLEIAENLVRFVKNTPLLKNFVISVPVEINDDAVRFFTRDTSTDKAASQPVVMGEFKQTLFKSAKTEKEKFYRDILFQTAEDMRLAYRDTAGNLVFDGIRLTPEVVEKYVTIKNKSISAHVVPVRDGLLSIGHRPKQAELCDLRDEGFTHIVTILAKSEDAEGIGWEAEKIGLNWIWLRLGTAKVPVEDQTDLDNIKRTLRQLAALLQDETAKAKVYLHCSAGMHRTGMITFALLRWLGYDPVAAMNLLTRLRELTAQNVGEERIAWANSI